MPAGVYTYEEIMDVLGQGYDEAETLIDDLPEYTVIHIGDEDTTVLDESQLDAMFGTFH